MDKRRIDELIVKANAEIGPLLNSDGMINSTYDGKTSAFGVSLAMMGLKPTLAIYYNESENSSVKSRNILEVVAKMLSKASAKALVEEAIGYPYNSAYYKSMHQQVKECAIALKMVIRTYPQKRDSNDQ